jgi:hypothetical protein
MYLQGEVIVDGTVTANKIDSNTITANEIASGTITASEIGVGSVKDIDSNAAVASDLFSGDYSDLSGTPTLGTLSSLDKITDSTYIGDGVIVTSKIAVDTALANEVLAKNASITNTLTMGSSGKITNSGSDWAVDSDGFSVQQGTLRRNSYDILDATDARVATFSANNGNVDLKADQGGMSVSATGNVFVGTSNGNIRLSPGFGDKIELFGSGSNKAEIRSYDSGLSGEKGVMMVFKNPIPESDLTVAKVKNNLDQGEGAISAVEFSDGNVNLLWIEYNNSGDVNIDSIF